MALFVAITAWFAVLGLVAVAALNFICVRELRRLITQTRKMITIYFPAYLNKEIENKEIEGKKTDGTFVKYEKEWSDDREPTD